MELEIIKEKVSFNKSKLGNEKVCVFIQFPNCISTKTYKRFRWMPTYEQLDQIKKALQEIEEESWK